MDFASFYPRIKATSEIDARDHFVLTKHVNVTFTIFEQIEVQLFDVMEAGNMFWLDIRCMKVEASCAVRPLDKNPAAGLRRTTAWMFPPSAAGAGRRSGRRSHPRHRIGSAFPSTASP
ncbi:hypothetical protein C7U89_23575 [Bradyrhizobium sp. WBOS4]|nr:hypothetical protein [Bradyrhizobium sp. WBOS8]MDD1585893.1 hypothetical protein [Bradyrhizobium sp. WBOS4]UUO47679.1 hypothetical protein DCM78_12515 [Bradyrhizobium sp. WBOS04]UUO61296.1 hypothetical protein DCM80_20255 [Bradyrhizobium sp. WBOS08]